MEAFLGSKTFITCPKLSRNAKTQDVKIFQGMPVVCYKNDDKLDIYNSEMFTVERVDTEANTFTVSNADTTLTFEARAFRSYFLCAFCITIHVSQGCTFDEPFTIHDWSNKHMSCSAKYVALSRSTSIKHIQIA